MSTNTSQIYGKIINCLIVMLVKTAAAWVLIAGTLVPLLLLGSFTNQMDMLLNNITPDLIFKNAVQYTPFVGDWLDVVRTTFDVSSLPVANYATHFLLTLIDSSLIAIFVFLIRRFAGVSGVLLPTIHLNGVWSLLAELPASSMLAVYTIVYATLVTNLIESFMSPDSYLLWAAIVVVVLIVLCFLAKKSSILTLDKLGEFLVVLLCTAIMYVIVFCMQLLPFVPSFSIFGLIVFTVVLFGCILAVTMIPAISFTRGK